MLEKGQLRRGKEVKLEFVVGMMVEVEERSL